MRFNLIILIFLSQIIFSQDERYILSTIAFYNVENLFDATDDPKNSWVFSRLRDKTLP